MTDPVKQPERLPDDGAVAVTLEGASHYRISVGEHSIKVSGFNAWRLFGMLAIMLGIRLPSALAKRIKL